MQDDYLVLHDTICFVNLKRYSMKTFTYTICFLIINILICCQNKNDDQEYFNGDIFIVNDTIKTISVKLKEVPLHGTNYGYISVYDSLMIFMNPKLPNDFFVVFNVDTGEEIGTFCKKGGGHDELFAVAPIFQFFKEGDDLKALLFAASESELLTWNISKSIKQGATLFDTIVSYNRKIPENNGAGFQELFRLNEDTLFAYVESIPLGEEAASLPFFQKRTIKDNILLKDYQIYKKPVKNGKASIIPEAIYNANHAFNQDGSKIAQAMSHLSQLNIIDTHTGQVTGYRMENSPDFTFFETEMNNLNDYYLRIQADNDHIYVSYWGKNPWGRFEFPFIEIIHVFDWNGKLIHKLKTDQAIGDIFLDTVRHRLYITHGTTDKVFYLDLNDI